MKESLLDVYNSIHPDFLDSLKIFSETNAKRILKKLRSGSDRNNFRSTLAEIEFGKKFHELGLQIELEKEYSNGQEPDWTLGINDVFAICEVYRLGTSQNDQRRSDFENILISKIQKLQFDCWVKINFIEEYFDTSKYSVDTFEMFNVDLIVNEVEEWLVKAPQKIGDKIIVDSNFEFEICKIKTNITHVCCAGNTNSIDFKPSKLEQYPGFHDSEITKKLTKYNEIISQNRLPYFLGISLDFVGGFDHQDFVHKFLGKGFEFLDFDKPEAARTKLKDFGKTWTELGEFYKSPQLSGIITLYGNKFQFLVNPMQQQVIHNDKNALLKKKLSSLSILI